MDIDFLGKVNNEIENLEEIVRRCYAVEVADVLSSTRKQSTARGLKRMPNIKALAFS